SRPRRTSGRWPSWPTPSVRSTSSFGPRALRTRTPGWWRRRASRWWRARLRACGADGRLMPTRAAPGDREQLEAALTPSLRAALQELRVLHDVDDWQASPLGPPFQQAAALLRAARIVDREGCPPRMALDRAAVSLGLSPETVAARASRWPRASRPM